MFRLLLVQIALLITQDGVVLAELFITETRVVKLHVSCCWNLVKVLY